MEKKKKPIEDEALDRVTGGDGGQQSDNYCGLSPTKEHEFQMTGYNNQRCMHCGYEKIRFVPKIPKE